jgi:Recombination endonuclease VII
MAGKRIRKHKPLSPEQQAAKRAYVSAWQKVNREKRRASQRRRMGIPEALRASGEWCECCGRLPSHALRLDHDHVSGAFRGWLCISCNAGIGFLGDDIHGLEKAIQYLKRAENE